MTPAQSILPILAALLILAALACAAAREVAALRSGRPDPQSRDILCALCAGLGLLAAALVWGAV